MGSEQLFLLGLSLTREILGIELSDRVIQKIQADLLIELYLPHVRQRLFSEADCQNQFWEIYLNRLLVLDRSLAPVSSYTDLIWQFMRFATIPTIDDKNFLPMPTHLNFLYYLITPILLHRLD